MRRPLKPLTPSLWNRGRPQGGRESEGKGPRSRPQRRLDGRVAKAVGGGYCRLQMPLRLALGVRGTVAGHRLGRPSAAASASFPPLCCAEWDAAF